MTDPTQIPFLIKLLDDESPNIQSKVKRELDAFGPLLMSELRKISFPLSNRQKESLDLIFERQQRAQLRRLWPSWYAVEGGYPRLEAALSLISDYLTAYDYDIRLSGLLDDLATQYRRKYNSKDPRLLAQFLFDDLAMQGNDEDYYNPQNSNMNFVINEKQGIPISLVSIYMLVGYRVGIPIEGCPFPGHFLARIELYGQNAFIDCYSNGQLIMESDFLKARDEIAENITDTLYEQISTEAMIRRYLANLVRAFQIEEDLTSANFVAGLFEDLEFRIANKTFETITPDQIINCSEPRYLPGNLVKHSRYGYRAIVVDIDPECRATDEWYYGNQTQPSREQPWFHLLVHDSEQVTYVAENNLLPDESRHEIKHPLLSYFFVRSDGGAYLRNENQWPETDF